MSTQQEEEWALLADFSEYLFQRDRISAATYADEQLVKDFKRDRHYQNTPAIILCNWQPSRLDFDTIKRESDELLERLGVIPEREPNDPDGLWWPRSPEYNYNLAHDEEAQTYMPHRDGDKGYQPPQILLWSNKLPVEVEGMECRDGDVVLVYNLRTYHNLPVAVKTCRDRWSLRVWCRWLGVKLLN